MAKSPKFKVYRNGKYVASCKYVEDAAMIIAGSSSGQIRYGHSKIVWDEGKESMPASESYDNVTDVVFLRIRQYEQNRS